MQRKTISFDLDDTLFDVTRLFIQYANKNWGTNLSFSKVTDSDRVFPGLTDEEETNLWLKFLEDPQTLKLSPSPQTKKTIDSLSKKYRLITISARDPVLQASGKIWLDKYFKGKFDKVIFKKGKNGSNVKKSYLCLKEKAVIHIDDNIKHIKDCQEHGIAAILINKPWNAKSNVRVKRISHLSAREIESSIENLS